MQVFLRTLLVLFVKFSFFYSLWRLLKCDRSELCEVCVPLLLHCISLPCGAEALVHEVESTFTNKDWRIRFDGVSKVY